MPLVTGQANALAGRENDFRSVRRFGRHETRLDCVKIALINNMPDGALEATELQFFELLDAAAGEIPVSVTLFSLPELPRSDLAQRHLSKSYFNIEDLLNWPCDGVIITGTEPRRPHLRDEPYWATLVKIFDWAEYSTTSTVLSCLAAHASVLYNDGIERHALGTKQCGVFEYKRIAPHRLTSCTGDVMRIPHSRWNELRMDALASGGYTVLTQSPEGGVDLFVKKKRSLFVYFQGHPEYATRTLFEEYKRDIKRFLRGEKDTYPSMPHGYFDAAATRLLSEFREKAMHSSRTEVVDGFPEAAVADTLRNTWHSSAICLYRSWLQYVASSKAGLRRSRLGIDVTTRPVSSGLRNTSD